MKKYRVEVLDGDMWTTYSDQVLCMEDAEFVMNNAKRLNPNAEYRMTEVKSFKRYYFIEAARESENTLGEYYADARENYVLFDKNEKLVCFNNGMPMVFGSLGDAIAEVENWPIEERALFTVSIEQMLIDKIVEGVYYEH